MYESEGKENRQPGKNTECRPSINFRFENPMAKCNSVLNKKRKYPLWFKVEFSHNQSINRAEYFKYLDVSRDTKQADMFSQGLLPSGAHAERRSELRVCFPPQGLKFVRTEVYYSVSSGFIIGIRSLWTKQLAVNMVLIHIIKLRRHKSLGPNLLPVTASSHLSLIVLNFSS